MLVPGMAAQIRQEVRRRLTAGERERTIVAALVDEYGEGLLGASPVAEGEAEPPAAAAAGVDPALRTRLDEALRAFDREV